MRKILAIILATSILLLASCHKKSDEEKLKDAMKLCAAEYLKNDGITAYDSLRVDCVDTVTEMGYAKLNSELLAQMAEAYLAMYEEAVNDDDIAKVDAISRYLNETNRTKADFDDLMESGDLKSDGILLFMVTGAYYHDGQAEELMFLVQPDKKTLYTLDPFGDNLLYREDS
jgi:hypothetical protein